MNLQRKKKCCSRQAQLRIPEDTIPQKKKVVATVKNFHPPNHSAFPHRCSQSKGSGYFVKHENFILRTSLTVQEERLRKISSLHSWSTTIIRSDFVILVHSSSGQGLVSPFVMCIASIGIYNIGTYKRSVIRGFHDKQI